MRRRAGGRVNEHVHAGTGPRELYELSKRALADQELTESHAAPFAKPPFRTDPYAPGEPKYRPFIPIDAPVDLDARSRWPS